MRFPSIKTVAAELADQKRWWRNDLRAPHANDPDGDTESYIDVRLQVHEDGDWSLHTGDSQYDTDHRGYWGAGCLGRDTDCYKLAKDLLDEAKEYHAETRPAPPAA